MTDHWYALQVRPRFEKYVETHLGQKGFDVFLPTYTTERRWSDRTKLVSQPLFPSYVFCKFDVNARLPVLITPGVNFVVGCGKSPVPVDETELLAVRRVMESGVATQPWPYLNVGETVRIEHGPLEGMEGLVTRIKNSYRLVVSVSLLMRSVCVELDRQWIKPVGPAGGRSERVSEPSIVTRKTVRNLCGPRQETAVSSLS